MARVDGNGRQNVTVAHVSHTSGRNRRKVRIRLAIWGDAPGLRHAFEAPAAAEKRLDARRHTATCRGRDTSRRVAPSVLADGDPPRRPSQRGDRRTRGPPPTVEPGPPPRCGGDQNVKDCATEDQIKTLMNKLVEYWPSKDAFIRLGWEFNGNW
ncbi:hypothetical protein Franean1_2365 [Parafrankia sp. EAN1pec]|uniref:hypothetical protein n=1 Tax=Parafrankia sp. (strain EAN1pec) TaxID=298653 RepID=UPI00015D9E8E|nr:hypothetical protein Franean1_2365 [Frankia sp. EAN1pec]